MTANTNALALVPPEHPQERCEPFNEHDQEWLECLDCGAQWAVHGSTLEQVSEGDGSCFELAVLRG